MCIRLGPKDPGVSSLRLTWATSVPCKRRRLRNHIRANCQDLPTYVLSFSFMSIRGLPFFGHKWIPERSGNCETLRNTRLKWHGTLGWTLLWWIHFWLTRRILYRRALWKMLKYDQANRIFSRISFISRPSKCGKLDRSYCQQLPPDDRESDP